MLLSRVLQDMEIDWQGAVPDREISGVCCDSRLVKPGFLFVAIRGFQTDGHRFISKALENGAAAVLCEEASPLAPCAVTTDSRILTMSTCVGGENDKRYVVQAVLIEDAPVE